MNVIFPPLRHREHPLDHLRKFLCDISLIIFARLCITIARIFTVRHDNGQIVAPCIVLNAGESRPVTLVTIGSMEQIEDRELPMCLIECIKVVYPLGKAVLIRQKRRQEDIDIRSGLQCS